MKDKNNNEPLQEEKKEKYQNSKYIYLIYALYIIILIISLLLRSSSNEVNIILGDAGGISTALCYVISIIGLKWLPILSVAGIILTYKREKNKDMTAIYFFSILLITITTIVLYIITKK